MEIKKWFKKIVLFICLSFSSFIGFSQLGAYFEGFGNAHAASFNLEFMMLNSDKIKLVSKFGAGLTLDRWDPEYNFYWESFPVGFNSIFFNSDHHLEIGIGL